VPDRERPEGRDRDQAGAEQDRNRPRKTRPRLRALVKKPPQATSRCLSFLSVFLPWSIAIALKHRAGLRGD
jgi:hypothetical protein